MTENNVSTPQELDLQHFTPEQIEEYCNSAVEEYYRRLPDNVELLLVAAQIIRQLQVEAGVEKVGFTRRNFQEEYPLRIL